MFTGRFLKSIIVWTIFKLDLYSGNADRFNVIRNSIGILTFRLYCDYFWQSQSHKNSFVQHFLTLWKRVHWFSDNLSFLGRELNFLKTFSISALVKLLSKTSITMSLDIKEIGASTENWVLVLVVKVWYHQRYLKAIQNN